VREADLSDRGGGLALLEPELAGGEPELAAPERDRAGRDEHHFLPARTQARDVGGERLEPRAVDAARRFLDEQRRADLDDDPARPGET
jgi:hypothetical protein